MSTQTLAQTLQSSVQYRRHLLYCLDRTKTYNNCCQLCNKQSNLRPKSAYATKHSDRLCSHRHLLLSTDARYVNFPTSVRVRCAASKPYPHCSLVIPSSPAAFEWMSATATHGLAMLSIVHVRGMLTRASPKIHSRFSQEHFFRLLDTAFH